MALGWDVLCARLAGLNGVVAAYVAFSVTALIQTMLKDSYHIVKSAGWAPDGKILETL